MSDNRYAALLHDVWNALEKHGYKLPKDEQARHLAIGSFTVALLRLTEAFEGKEAGA